MRVEFYKPSEKHRLCAWEATRAKRTVVPGSVMAAGATIPHDLAQYVIEAATGTQNGFWGLVSRGATFKSTGRKRTKPGRALIAEHRDDLVASEALAGEHMERWRSGQSTPVTRALTEASARWAVLDIGERLVFDWPSSSASGTVPRRPPSPAQISDMLSDPSRRFHVLVSGAWTVVKSRTVTRFSATRPPPRARHVRPPSLSGLHHAT